MFYNFNIFVSPNLRFLCKVTDEIVECTSKLYSDIMMSNFGTKGFKANI